MTLRVGLVGAGPWATEYHAPMLAAGPRTSLAAIWARRPEASQSLAAAYDVPAVGSFEELLERCEAVAFAVPPDVQADLAPVAARAGRHLLLEKPLAFTVEDAESIVDAVEEAGVGSVLMLRNRFSDEGRRFVAQVRQAHGLGAQAQFVGGAALPGSQFATPWRVERGALFDLGPHVLDLVETALGPVSDLSAQGDPLRILTISTTHASGAVAQVAVSVTTPGPDATLLVDVWTDRGPVTFDGATSDAEHGVGVALTDALADAAQDPGARGPDAVDARRGLELQRLLARVEDALA